MTTQPVTPGIPSTAPVGVGVIGVGTMGAYHAYSLAQRIPAARLVGLADVVPGVAERYAAALGCPLWTRDYQHLLLDPAVEAVVVATPARYHTEAIVAAAQAGKAVFCEKPIAVDLAGADRSIHATRQAGVLLQIGFQRRFDRAFDRARKLADEGTLGRVQLLRSLTRDPGLDNPALASEFERIPPGTIFLETLIHDFDVLRFLAAGAEPVEVYAMADALIAPALKARGFVDTALVSVRYDSGALASADASFYAVYGYDVRAEVFGSEGMATVGEATPINIVHHTRAGSTHPRVHWFLEMFGEAYTAELAHFVAAVRGQAAPDSSGEDGRAALVMALAAMRSVETARPVHLRDIQP